MKKLQRVALAGAGKFSDSPLSKVRELAGCLGPVAAPSFRLANRLANSLRGGWAVAEYAEFADSPLVLISAPDQQARDLIAQLAAQNFPWADKAAVVCGDRLGSSDLAPLAALGAHPGSLSLVPGFEEPWFLIEGEKVVERLVRPLLIGRGIRVTTIGAGEKSRYLTALDAMGQELLPKVKSSLDALRQTGISNAEAAAMLERQTIRAMRSYFRSGKGPAMS